MWGGRRKKVIRTEHSAAQAEHVAGLLVEETEEQAKHDQTDGDQGGHARFSFEWTYTAALGALAFESALA